MPVYPTPTPIDLDVTVSVGSLEVTADHRGDTRVEVLPSRPGRAGDVSLAKETTVRFDGGRLTVVVPKRLTLFGPGDSVDIRIAVPAGSRATLLSSYGAIRMRGALGASDITATYGDVRIERTAALRLKAPYGEVEVGDVDGSLDLTFGHGRLRIGHVQGDADIRGSHGTIDLGTVDGSVDARTSGSIFVRRAGGDATIRTAHGAIVIGEATRGTLRLENGYSGIEVGVPLGIAAWIDAASKQGVVRNELTAENGPDGASGTVELRMRTNSGDILIRRATPAIVG
jgi:DUF4097 and DUF4098 domain-containing protein YvlB